MQRGRGNRGRGANTNNQRGAPSGGQSNQAKVTPHPWIGPVSQSSGEIRLLSDDQVKDFLFNGYLIVKPQLLPQFHEYILTAMTTNPEFSKAGNNILPFLPALNQVYEDPMVKGALTSLLGKNYIMHPHRAVHHNPPGFKSQKWHRDSFWGYGRSYRFCKIRYLMAMYYPQKTTLEMGPTGLKPGTQYYSIDPKFYQGDLTNHFTSDNIAQDKPGVVEAGSVIIIHYDIIHKGMENQSTKDRYMFKFQFMRMEEPTEPVWKCVETKWDAGNRASGSNHMKELEPICESIWIWMCGGKKNLESNTSTTTSTGTSTMVTKTTTNATSRDPTSSPIDTTTQLEILKKLDSSLEWERYWAAFTLSLNGHVNALVQRIDYKDEQYAICAAYALSCTPYRKEAVQALLKVLKNSQIRDDTCLSIIYTLGQISSESHCVIDIVKCLENRNSMWVHYLGCEALGFIGSRSDTVDPAVIALLSRELFSDHDRVRFSAALSLALIGPKASAAVPALRKSLSDYNRYVQAYTQLALKMIGTPEAQSLLLEFLWASRMCPLTTPTLPY